jgi:hypothetical protein
MERIHAQYSLALVLLVLAGCEGASTSWDVVDEGPAASASLISERDRHHDFGAVIGAQGKKREHQYRLVNTTDREVKILNVVNRKTCCGIVGVGPRILKPGEASHIDLTLMINEAFGEVVHETEVVTDSPSEPSIVLRTTARAVPALRVEEVARRESAPLIAGGPTRRVEFRVLASGTEAEPPVDLDRVELRSTTEAHWDGLKETVPSEDGLVVESRRFAASLDSTGPPGERRAEYLFQVGEQRHGRHVVAWEVVAPLRVSPEMIVVKPDQREFRLVLASRDERPFRITRIECASPEIRARASRTDASPSQGVRIEGVPKGDHARGVVSIFTDHPDEDRVDVPYVLID